MENSLLPRLRRRRGLARLSGLSLLLWGLLAFGIQVGVVSAQTGLTATAWSDGQVNLSWTTVPDGGPVYLRRCQGANCDVYNATIIASNLANPGSY